MLNLVPPNECLRARESVSARLDGELSELGAARLAAHLRTCADCRGYAAELEQLTGLLRAAPLAVPEVEIALPARRRIASLQIAAVAAGSSFALGRALGTGGSSTATSAAVTGADIAGVRADSTQQHILAMVRHLEPHGSLRIGTSLIAL